VFCSELQSLGVASYRRIEAGTETTLVLQDSKGIEIGRWSGTRAGSTAGDQTVAWRGESLRTHEISDARIEFTFNGKTFAFERNPDDPAYQRFADAAHDVLKVQRIVGEELKDLTVSDTRTVDSGHCNWYEYEKRWDYLGGKYQDMCCKYAHPLCCEDCRCYGRINVPTACL
jgi:hypothetical protein